MPSGTNRKQKDGYGLDILWPPVEQNDLESNVDIVFVHGLNGKRHGTWTKGDILWPQALLAKDFPKARIMTWGYDSRIMQFFGPVGQGSIHDHANELNNDLRSERTERHQIFRPLVFFAHSLGGLVVKSALFKSYLAGMSERPVTDHCAAIEKSTTGVIFAGTPHRGSDQTRWASCATRLATVVQKDHSSRMSRPLERGSETLEVLQDQFKKIQNNFHLFTFFEELPVHKVGKIVERDSAVINCDHEVTRMIHADHMEMVRFDDRSCNEYKKVKDAFQQIHQQSIYNSSQGTIYRPATFNRNHGSYTRVPEEFAPRNSVQQGLPTSQRQTIDLGRADTITAEDYARLTSRRSSGMSSGASSPRAPVHHLTNRASTTTIGTLGSTTSRRSDQSIPRLNEQEPSHPNETEQQQLVAQGKRLVRQRGSNFARNLITANQCFKRALDLVPPSSDLTPSAEIQYQLMGVEFEMAFHRDMTPQEKLSHLRSAEQHGWDASYNARQSHRAGLLAQIELYMAIIKGRSAEVNERLGVGVSEIRRQKDDALSEIAIKVERVRELRPTKIQESVSFAEIWTKRLEAPPPPQDEPAPAYSPLAPTPASASASPIPPPTSPSTQTDSLPAYSPPSSTIMWPHTSAAPDPAFAELDSSPPHPSNTTPFPSFAELDISGQLVPAHYLQPEPEPGPEPPMPASYNPYY